MDFLIRTCLPLLVLFAATLGGASETLGGDGGQVLFDRGEQVYIVYLGHLPKPDPSEPNETGFASAVEFAHHDLLNQVLDDGRL
nr:unnamed protein product [Digitaria exilis]